MTSQRSQHRLGGYGQSGRKRPNGGDRERQGGGQAGQQQLPFPLLHSLIIPTDHVCCSLGGSSEQRSRENRLREAETWRREVSHRPLGTWPAGSPSPGARAPSPRPKSEVQGVKWYFSVWIILVIRFPLLLPAEQRRCRPPPPV